MSIDSIKKKLFGDQTKDNTFETLAMQATEVGRLPNEDDPDIIDLIRRENEKSKKRKGRASTLLTTDETRNPDTLVSPF